MTTEHTSKFITPVLALAVVLLLAGAGFMYWRQTQEKDTQVYCTMEAKLCPDGSYVGRSGPKCEFASCPEVTNTVPAGTEGWLVVTDTESHITFRYPEKLETQYISTTDWPPKIQIVDQLYSCDEAGAETDRTGETSKLQLGDHEYCLTKVTEGAAGSIYTQYAYAFARDQKTAIATFTLRAVQCANYDEVEKTACEQERQTFDLNAVIDKIIQTMSSTPGSSQSHDGVYMIEGQSVTLQNGLSEVAETPDSATKVVTRYFGNDVTGDFNSDGQMDTAFLVTQQRGGSGTFYYLVALMGNESSGSGTNAILLGDRIAPQSTEFQQGLIVVNFAERKADESFSTSPSVARSMYIKVSDSTLTQVEPN